MDRPPVRKGQYNPNFLLPAIDLVMFAALMAVAGTYYFSTRGTEQILEAQQQVAQARQANQGEIEVLHEAMVLAERKNARLDSVRTVESERILGMVEAMQAEQNRIIEAKRIDQQLTEVVLDMRVRIERSDEQRRSYEATLLERDDEIANLMTEVRGLESALADTTQARRDLEDQIADLRRQREHDPLSIFPQRASLSSLVEAGDQSFYSVALAGVLGQVGDVNYGVGGQVGLGGEGSESVKEGAFFANIPLAFRRASLDVAGGVSSITDPTGDGDVTPHLGATLRYAPLRRERFFLLAGTKYRQEDVRLQVGIGFGRR